MRSDPWGELQRQLDQLDPHQLAHLAEYIRTLPPARKEHLDRLAAHLAGRLGHDTQPFSGAVIPGSHVDASGRHDGFDLRVVDRPDMSGFLTSLEWVYLTRRAAVMAIERARVRVGPAFSTALEIRAMRDAADSGSGPDVAVASATPTASDRADEPGTVTGRSVRG